MSDQKKIPEVQTRFSPDQVELLKAPLAKSRISQREGSGRMKLDYLEAWDVIDHANHVFGFDGWDCETLEMVETWSGANNDGKPVICFRAKVRVTVHVGDRRIVREGTGYGDGVDRTHGKASELATKEAESDAMKRAFRMFGAGFGNALYDKARENVVDDTAAADKPRDPPREPARTRPAPANDQRGEGRRTAAGRAVSDTPEDRRDPSEQERLQERNVRDERGERGAPEAGEPPRQRESASQKPAKGSAMAESRARAAWKAIVIPPPRQHSEAEWDAWTERLAKGIELAPDRDAAIELCSLNKKHMTSAGDVLGSNVERWAATVITRHHGPAKKESAR